MVFRCFYFGTKDTTIISNLQGKKTDWVQFFDKKNNISFNLFRSCKIPVDDESLQQKKYITLTFREILFQICKPIFNVLIHFLNQLFT